MCVCVCVCVCVRDFFTARRAAIKHTQVGKKEKKRLVAASFLLVPAALRCLLPPPVVVVVVVGGFVGSDRRASANSPLLSAALGGELPHKVRRRQSNKFFRHLENFVLFCFSPSAMSSVCLISQLFLEPTIGRRRSNTSGTVLVRRV